MCFNKIDMQDFFIAMVIKESCSMASDVDKFTIAEMNQIYDEIYKEYVEDRKSTLINPRWVFKRKKAKAKKEIDLW